MGTSASAGVIAVAALVLLPSRAWAQSSEPAPPSEDSNPAETSADSEVSAASSNPDAPPPVRGRPHGLVAESDLGVLGFLGQFRHVAPPAYWWRLQVGYEPFSWLMVYGAGELAFTDTGESQDESHTQGLPLWGFSGGARVTVHATERVAGYLEGELGAVTADIPHGSLAILGFRNAESLGLSFGGRVGIEWYQMDRHVALSVSGGLEYATGFSKTIGPTDLPMFWNSAVGLRYSF